MTPPRSWAGQRWMMEAPAACKFTIWRILKATAEQRRLNRGEIRMRCASAPAPWRDAGCDRSTWYRRKRRAAVKV
jgi:hypothetical protein